MILADDGRKLFGYLLYDYTTYVSIRLYLHIPGRMTRPTHGTGKLVKSDGENTQQGPMSDGKVHGRNRKQATIWRTEDRNEKGETRCELFVSDGCDLLS